MGNGHTTNGTIPPFVDEETERLRRQEQQSKTNTVVMVIGWLGLTIAMLGGAKVLYEYFFAENSVTGPSMIAQLVMLAITFLVGWIVSFVSIRKLGNIILPIVIRFYSFFVVGGLLIVYGRAVYKVFMEYELTLPKYTIVLIVGYLVLVSLHLLVEDHELGPVSMPLLIAGFVHLLLGVSHYVFLNAKKPEFVQYDLYLLGLVLGLVVLLQLKGLYRPVKTFLGHSFPVLFLNF